MGATLDEIDVLRPLITSPDDFIKLIAPYLDSAAAEGRQLMVVYLVPTKAAMTEQGVDFNAVIGEACQRLVRRSPSLANNQTWCCPGFRCHSVERNDGRRCPEVPRNYVSQ